MKANLNVETITDMSELFKTIHFCGLDILPQSLLDFAAHQPHNNLQPVLEPYRTDMPFLTTMCSIFAETVDTSARLENAIKIGSATFTRTARALTLRETEHWNVCNMSKNQWVPASLSAITRLLPKLCAMVIWIV